MHRTIRFVAVLAMAALLPAAIAGIVKQARVSDPAGEPAGAITVTPYYTPASVPIPDGMINQMPGFPVQMGAQFNFKPTRGLAFGDLDGDGDLEIIASSTDSMVYAWDYTGTAMPGFPVTLIGWAQYAPSVADMDGDGDLEIVQPTRGTTSGGRLYVLDHQGNVLPNFPMSFNNNNVTSCVTLWDLDADGQMEMIVPERAWPIGYLHVAELDGTTWGGNWPVALDHVPAATPAVGDVDDDGAPEIVFQSYQSVYVIEVDGTVAASWQISGANFSYQSAALADLDGDGDLEIVVGTHGGAPGCYIFHHDGTTYPGWPRPFANWSYCPPTVTDLEDDGVLDILDGQSGGVGAGQAFYAWTSAGGLKPGFPYVAVGGSEAPITVADIDGDGLMEIFADSNVTDAGNGFIHGVDAMGNPLPGFPLRPVGFTYLNGAQIADVDGDGDYELGVQSYQDFTVDVNLYDLETQYVRTERDWRFYHARQTRGGLYPVPLDNLPGDMNCDGFVDNEDIDPFVLALTGGQAAYQSAWPNCRYLNADVNGDGFVDNEDIDPFVALITGP